MCASMYLMMSSDSTTTLLPCFSTGTSPLGFICVAVCCSVLQCVAVYCNVFNSVLQHTTSLLLCASTGWSALGKLKFERAQVSFGVCKAKVMSTDKFWGNWIYMNTLCTLVRDFDVKALHVESYPRDSKRVFGGRRCVKRRLLRTLGDERVSNDVKFFVSCFGHTSLSESFRRRSKLLPAVQT